MRCRGSAACRRAARQVEANARASGLPSSGTRIVENIGTSRPDADGRPVCYADCWWYQKGCYVGEVLAGYLADTHRHLCSNFQTEDSPGKTCCKQ